MEGTSSKKESKVKVYLHRYFIDAMSAFEEYFGEKNAASG